MGTVTCDRAERRGLNKRGFRAFFATLGALRVSSACSRRRKPQPSRMATIARLRLASRGSEQGQATNSSMAC